MGGYSVNRLLMDCRTTHHFQKIEASTKHEVDHADPLQPQSWFGRGHNSSNQVGLALWL
jgi:hypothetical protein